MAVSLVSLVVFLIVLGLAFWIVSTLSAAFGIPPPIVTVLQVLIVLIAVVYLLDTFGLISNGPILRVH